MEDDDDVSTMNPETAEVLSTDQEAGNPTSTLQDAWRIIVTMAHRLKHLETWHQQRLNARQNKEEGAAASGADGSDGCTLAGIYRFEEIMSQAREILREPSDLQFLQDMAASGATYPFAPLVPEPPPIVHSFRSCSIFPSSVIPDNEEPDDRDELISRILSQIEPHDSQRMYRGSVRAYVGRIVRRAIGCKVFDVGYHALQCFLPTDPLRFSVLVGRVGTLPAEWLPLLIERLHVLANKSDDSYRIFAADLLTPNEDDPPEDPAPEVAHEIDNVQVSGEGLTCVIDRENVVEIIPNDLSDLRFAAFLDEVMRLVGKDNLFSKSLLLIRSWWIYQAHENKGEPVFNDMAICVLVVGIFNQHHARIFHPLHALSLFLAEYSELDWSQYAVTIQGVVPFRHPQARAQKTAPTEPNATSNEDTENANGKVIVPSSNDTSKDATSPWLRLPTESELLTAQTINRYGTYKRQGRNRNNPSRTTTDAAGAAGATSAATAVSSTASVPQAAKAGEGETASQPGQQPATATQPAAAQPAAAQPAAAQPTQPAPKNPQNVPKIDSFRRLDINIVHPLTHENMIQPVVMSAGGGDKNRASRLRQVFENGAKELCKALQLPSELSMLNRFFISVTNTFKDGFRPDVFSGSQSMRRFSKSAPKHDESDIVSRRIGEMKPFNNLWEQFCYADLMLTGHVSECAVLILSTEILNERGALPVGEVGKILQETTGNTSLSSRLKEKYGGLKKFLERFPDEYLICNDHPFNPRVFVKKGLAPDEIDQISRGIVPVHLSSKLKKQPAPKPKKMGMPSPVSVNSVLDGHYGSPAMGSRSSMSIAPGIAHNPNQGYMGGQGGGGGGNVAAYRALQQSMSNRLMAARTGALLGRSANDHLAPGLVQVNLVQANNSLAQMQAQSLARQSMYNVNQGPGQGQGQGSYGAARNMQGMGLMQQQRVSPHMVDRAEPDMVFRQGGLQDNHNYDMGRDREGSLGQALGGNGAGMGMYGRHENTDIYKELDKQDVLDSMDFGREQHHGLLDPSSFPATSHGQDSFSFGDMNSYGRDPQIFLGSQAQAQSVSGSPLSRSSEQLYPSAPLQQQPQQHLAREFDDQQYGGQLMQRIPQQGSVSQQGQQQHQFSDPSRRAFDAAKWVG